MSYLKRQQLPDAPKARIAKASAQVNSLIRYISRWQKKGGNAEKIKKAEEIRKQILHSGLPVPVEEIRDIVHGGC